MCKCYACSGKGTSSFSEKTHLLLLRFSFINNFKVHINYQAVSPIWSKQTFKNL